MLVEHIILISLCGLGVFHGIFLGLFLSLRNPNQHLSHRILGVLLLVFGIRISKSIVLYFTSELDFLVITLGLSLTLTFGPLFYFYSRSFIDESFTFKKKHSWHFIPFFIFTILNSLSLLSKEFYLTLGVYFIYLHFLSYIIYSFFWQMKFLKQGKIQLSTKKKNWILYIHIGVVFIWASYFMFLLDEIIPYITGPVTYSLVIYPLSFWAITKNIFILAEEKYKNLRLGYEDSIKLIEKLNELMQSQRPYLNADLKLADLSSQVKITPHELSQVVNANYHQNFQQYLNSYRVKAAEKMLASPEYDHLTISSIAFESGFNSLSAFNTAFKKQLNKIPSQYRKDRLA